MKTDFDFNKIGKRMPYSVPDNFFSDMENRLFQEAEQASPKAATRRRPFLRIVFSAVATAAAAVALLLVFNHETASTQVETVGFSDVEQAFAQLSNTDQTYLMEVYQNDVFLNEQ